MPAINGWINNFSDVPSVYKKGNIVGNNFSPTGIAHWNSVSSTSLIEVKIKEGGIIHGGGILLMKCCAVENLPINEIGEGILFAESQLRMSSIDGNGFNKITGSFNNIGGLEVDLLDIEVGMNDFSNGHIEVGYLAPLPSFVGGNGNQYFAGAGMGAGTPNPTTAVEPSFIKPKAIFYNASSINCSSSIYNNACPKIPLQWQFLPNPLPTPTCGTTGGGGNTTNPTGSVSPLVACATCPTVISTNFSNVPFNQAILTASGFMELTDSTKNDFTALQLFHEIFTSTTINFNDPNQAFLVKYAYSNMKNALQYCFVTGRLNESANVPNLHIAVTQFMDVLHLRQQPVTAQNVAEQFFLELDEALIYRLIGQRDEAITRLEAIDNCFLTDRHRQILKRTIATTKVERDVINGTVPLMAAVDLMDAIPRLEIPSNASAIDTTATIHSTAIIGRDVTIGSNVVIEQNAVIGNHSTIENNVTIKKNTIIGENVVIKAHTLLEKDVQIGNNTIVGNFNEIKKNTSIGNHTVLGDSVAIEKEVTIYDYVEIANKVTIKKETFIGNGAFIGAHTKISKEITIGELSIIRENSTIEDKVKIGNRNVMAKEVTVKNKTKTGKEVLVEVGKIIPPNKTICDNANVSGNFNFSTSNCPIALPVLDNSTNTCSFAMGYAQTRTNFLNGFTLLTKKTPLTGEGIAFKPNQLASFYEWNFGDCSTSTDENPTHTFLQPGIYLITLTQGTSCDTTTYFGAITMFPNPTSVITPVSPTCANTSPVAIRRETSLAKGVPSCVSASGCPSFIPLNTANCRLHFVWEFAADTATQEQMIGLNDSTLLADTVFKQIDANGTIQTSLFTTVEAREQTVFTFENLARTDTASAEIIITSSFSVEATFDGCAQQGVQFISTVSGGVAPFSYSWNFGNGTTSTQPSPFLSPLDTGLLAVNLLVTDANNCTNQFSGIVFIADCNANARINGNEHEEVAESKKTNALQTTELKENNIKAYPNPTTGQVTFEYELENNQATLIITDLVGRTINTTVLIGNNKTNIDLSAFPKGIYLYQVIGQANILTSDKLILMK